MCTNAAIPEKIRQCLGRPKDAAKREKILQAAGILFLKHGYELTSMEALAKMADVSKLTVYSHFDNKAELFKEVIRQRCDRQAAPEGFLNFAKLPVEQALLQLGKILTGLIFSSDSIRLLRILQSEAERHPQLVKIFYEAAPQRVKTAFGELLKEWVSQGQLVVTDIPVATEQFFSLLKGELYLKAMMSLEPIPDSAALENHVRAGISLFLAGYLSKNQAG
jgi:TetR/AcrR family transcriptional repressor of mexJK operon